MCNEVKSDAESKHIHVMMLTAKGGKRDLEVGLSQDADEYVAKPFSPMKIVARVKELVG